MAGGSGTRLWPLSRNRKPKQFIDVMGVGKSMLQLTYNRFRAICPPERFVVVTIEDYHDFVVEQLPDVPHDNILCEPFKRNTTACVALANCFIRRHDPDAIIVVTPSDHLILEENAFMSCVSDAVSYVSNSNQLMTIGIKASRPDTAFGYIQIGDKVGNPDSNIHEVRTFTEKPNAEMAQTFFDCGDFCWNSGVCVWKLSSIVDAMHRHMPRLQALFDGLTALPSAPWSPQELRSVYAECENISISYGVLEKARNVVVSLSDAAWCDVGGWDSVYDQAPKDAAGNANPSGTALIKSSDGCLIHLDDDASCVVEGLHDYMVVLRGKMLLVCPRSSGPNTWRFASEIKAELD